MKKFAAIIVSLLLFITTAGCASKDETHTLDYVKENGYVVHEDLDITSGQAVWDDFAAKAKSGETCEVLLAFYYTLGDPSQYSLELYEKEKERYPLLYTKILSFDGEKYTLKYKDDGENYVEEYKYMVRLTGEPMSETAIFSDYVYHVLVDDKDVTWDEIFRGMVSSQSGAYIRHSTVYSDITHK